MNATWETPVAHHRNRRRCPDTSGEVLFGDLDGPLKVMHWFPV